MDPLAIDSAVISREIRQDRQAFFPTLVGM